MVAFLAGLYQECSVDFQYSLCRVVLMVGELRKLKGLFLPFSTRSVESF